MAEQQIQNALTPDTSVEETHATPEQQQPVRHRQPNAKNGNSKRSSTRKTTSSEANVHSSNGTNGATPKKTRTKQQPAVAPVDAAESTTADAAPGAPTRKRA